MVCLSYLRIWTHTSEMVWLKHYQNWLKLIQKAVPTVFCNLFTYIETSDEKTQFAEVWDTWNDKY